MLYQYVDFYSSVTVTDHLVQNMFHQCDHGFFIVYMVIVYQNEFNLI